MAHFSWNWKQIALATAAYWIVVVAGWWFYTTRPSQQARARASAKSESLAGSKPGEEIVVISHTVNITTPLSILVGPPQHLVVLRWVF
jgi:hypothetical protein